VLYLAILSVFNDKHAVHKILLLAKEYFHSIHIMVLSLDVSSQAQA